jgi:hypothetical protein
MYDYMSEVCEYIARFYFWTCIHYTYSVPFVSANLLLPVAIEGIPNFGEESLFLRSASYVREEV